MALTAATVVPAAASEPPVEVPVVDEPTYQVIVREETAEGEAPEFEVVETDLEGIIELINDPEVDSIELDGEAELMWRPSDPEYLNQWEHHVTGLETAWDTTRGSSDIVIAVVDSGVNPTSEFGSRLLPGASFIDADPLVDTLGHGTSVAGVAAAEANNGTGGVGVCPECTILPVQVALPSGSVPWSAAANGIVWAVDNGADILNLSFGSQSPSAVLEDAVEYALSRGVIVIAAAGNYGTTTQVYPAAYDGVISVSGHNRDSDRYSWASHGAWADVAAPGCARSVATFGTKLVCGTSFASPWAAGAAALLLDTNGSMSQAAIEASFEATARSLDWVETGAIDASVLLNGGVANLVLADSSVTAGSVALQGEYRGDVIRVDLVVDGNVTSTDTAPTAGSFGLTWNAGSVVPGTYQLQVDAVSSDGDRTRSGATAVQVLAAPEFSDVVPHAFYADAVQWMVAEGITSGTTPTTFSPGDNVTRGQLATFLHRFADLPAPAINADFDDVAPGAFYATGVSWMVGEGITNGTGPGQFSPNDTVTRGQLATFLHRFTGTPAASTTADFIDVPAGAFYTAAVNWMVDEGITTGTSPTTFSPDSGVTRGQLATFLWRFAGSPSV